jgi:glutathione S-transferase
MKLYDGMGPNPRLVRMFIAEKGIDVPIEKVDLVAGENRRAPYTEGNPYGQLPALELDDGSMISETVVICEYLDELYPDPPLIGRTPEERARTRMWRRRAELHGTDPMANGFRYAEGLPLFQDRIRTIPHAAEDLKTLAREGLARLDELIAGQDFIAGDSISLADIYLFCFLDFGASVGQPVDESNENILAWMERMRSRPSAAATA